MGNIWETYSFCEAENLHPKIAQVLGVLGADFVDEAGNHNDLCSWKSFAQAIPSPDTASGSPRTLYAVRTGPFPSWALRFSVGVSRLIFPPSPPQGPQELLGHLRFQPRHLIEFATWLRSFPHKHSIAMHCTLTWLKNASLTCSIAHKHKRSCKQFMRTTAKKLINNKQHVTHEMTHEILMLPK